jgi:hypothetical protein
VAFVVVSTIYSESGDKKLSWSFGKFRHKNATTLMHLSEDFDHTLQKLVAVTQLQNLH